MSPVHSGNAMFSATNDWPNVFSRFNSPSGSYFNSFNILSYGSSGLAGMPSGWNLNWTGGTMPNSSDSTTAVNGQVYGQIQNNQGGGNFEFELHVEPGDYELYMWIGLRRSRFRFQVDANGDSLIETTTLINNAGFLSAGTGSANALLKFPFTTLGTGTVRFHCWSDGNNANGQTTLSAVGLYKSAAPPEINIKGNSLDILDGDNTPSSSDHTDFGTTAAVPITRTFTIENTGVGNLNLGTGAITLTGPDAAYFSVSNITLPATVAGPSGSVPFNVTYTPLSVGNHTATVNIASNDPDETIYDFVIQGANTCVAPTIPSGASSNSPICSGQSLNLNGLASGTEPLNYSWTGAGTFTNGSTATPNVTGATTSTYTVTVSNSCGSITRTAAVTVNANTSNTANTTSCDNYLWSVNNTTYTSSGMYTSVNGCHSDTLNLTINTSTSSTTNISACDSYTWALNGTTYTQSGTYTASSINAMGCPHVETLNLTINHSSSGSISATVCDSYIWSVTGLPYTTAGTYTNLTVNSSGCPHTETLNLTVNASTANTTTVTACDMYTWSVNSLTYTSSGTYVVAGTNAAGCPHTETLNLTINASTANTTTVVACGSYLWSANGMTYTQSGTYTAVSTNAVGCTHVATLNLTIHAIPVVTAQNVNGCPGTPLILIGSPTGGTYSLPNPYSGTDSTYTYFFTSTQGCTNSATGAITRNMIGQVTNLTISGITSASSNISWGGLGVWFDVRYRPTSSSAWINSSSSASFSRLITGLTGSTTYTLEVRGYCIASGTPSSWVGTSFTTLSGGSGSACATPIPTATTNITKSAAKLNWTHPGANYYNVRLRKTTVTNWTNIGTATPIFKLVSGCTPNTQYEYQVQAVCASSYTSAWSASGFFTTLATKEGEDDEIAGLGSDVLIFPNPTDDELNLIFSLENPSLAVLKLVDMSGRTVKMIQLNTSEGQNEVSISIADIASGIYSLQLISDGLLIHNRRVIRN